MKPQSNTNQTAGSPVVGDYVLATKYRDGDPQDHWCVGFYAGLTNFEKYDSPRYDVVDGEGNNFRGNGFRRIKKITPARGAWMLEHAKDIELSGRSVWYFARCPMKPLSNVKAHTPPLATVSDKTGTTPLIKLSKDFTNKGTGGGCIACLEVSLQCPFCGGKDIRFNEHGPMFVQQAHRMVRNTDTVWSTCCYDCGATFPNRHSKETLIKCWNRRPNSNDNREAVS